MAKGWSKQGEGLLPTGLPGIVFTDLALWAGWVIELPCPSVCMCVCMCVTKVVIVDNGQSIRFLSFFIKRSKVLRILNLEGHQNCMIGSKDKTILTIFFFGSGTSLLWIMEDSAGEVLWLVTCDMIFFRCKKSHKKCQKSKNKKKKKK